MTLTAFLEPQGKSAVAMVGSEARSSPFAYCIYRSEGDQNLRKRNMKLQMPVLPLHSKNTAFKQQAFLLVPATKGLIDQT